MPIYEYACAACGREFEALVRNGSQPACPQCQSHHLNKKLSVFAAHGTADTRAALPSPCGTCGHPDGPGSCAIH
jgi:putative FmdB family regulatory protein